AFPGNIRISYMVNESSHTPQFRFNLAASHVFVANWTLDTMQYDDPVGGLSVPIIDFTNAPSITSFEVHGQGCATGSQPVFAIAPGQPGLFFEGNTVNCSIIGSDSLIVRGPSQDSYLNSSVAISGTGKVGIQLTQPAAPAVSTSGTSGPPAGTYNYFLLDNDVFNGTSIAGLRSSNIAVNGSQGVLVTFPAFQLGKVS